MTTSYRAAIVTVSDSVAAGTREDVSGPTVRQILEQGGWTIVSTEVLPDDFSLIRERLEALSGSNNIDAVLTTGGTGIGPRDRTPEATTTIMERALPGLAELIRMEGVKKTPLAALSRGVAGIKGRTLFVNLPGNPEGAGDSLRTILPVLPHAVDMMRGGTHDQPEPDTAATDTETAPAPASAAAEENTAETPNEGSS